MIARKTLIAKLNSMNLDTILIAGYQRTPNWRGYAVIEALRPLIGVETFNQREYVTTRHAQKSNPKWFKQLFTDLEWAVGDITAGSTLYALCAK
jgi:hypothetical protein